MKLKFLATTLCILVYGLALPTTVRAIDIPAERGGYLEFAEWYTQKNPGAKLPFKSVAIYDFDSFRPLSSHAQNLVLPTASLMKLITAGTLLKNDKLNWFDELAFTEADNETDLRKYVGKRDRFVLLRLDEGETISVKDMFASMLIVSANNAAVRLAKYDAGSLSAFLKKMKKTALEWGMTKTKIDDPSGLSLKNTSTAHDLGLAICNALRLKEIAEFAALPQYDFQISVGKEKKLQHTVHAIRQNPTKYFGGKTGYLTESKYHVAAGVITPHGRKLCVAVLTSPTRAASESVLPQIAKWADENFMWPGQ